MPRLVADRQEEVIFQQGSTTYFWSSKFFPKALRSDVGKLYSFVRVADNLVDAQPQQRQAFYMLRNAWNDAVANPAFDTTSVPGEPVEHRVVKNMVSIGRKYQFEEEWVGAFLDAMQSDLDGRTYETLDDTIVYMHGSAEVIGLMMCKIMGLDHAAYPAAQMQGRAMQYINFIRDIAEDNQLGRCYIPQSELKKFGLKDLSRETARAKPEAFKKCIQAQLLHYRAWQAEAESGYAYLPKRLLIPVRTAAKMYNWTADQVEKNPLEVYYHKIKPSKMQVLLTGLRKK